MKKTFHLTIAKVGENLFDGEAVAVHLPGTEGEFTVLAQHEAFVSELRPGSAKIELADDTKQEIPLTAGGVAEVSGGQATVLL